MTPFRTDIQALRGLAVLLVVLHHAKTGMLGAGYLGVDIFFVISGYLITRLVRDDIIRGDFSFLGFYFRRAKRLLPAAYVTFVFTAMLAPLFLTSVELDDLAKQVVGAVTFTANIVLWRQSGYFDSAAELKPLLHVWSLSLEEQYYLLLPAALVLTPRRYWLPLSLMVLAGSFALCLAVGRINPEAAFYLLPTRAWELAAGSVVALAWNRISPRLVAALFWPACVALIAVPIMPLRGAHPGWVALIACTATLIVILRNHPLLNRAAPVRALAAVGDVSYSLYLAHWPVFAFAHNLWLG